MDSNKIELFIFSINDEFEILASILHVCECVENSLNIDVSNELRMPVFDIQRYNRMMIKCINTNRVYEVFDYDMVYDLRHLNIERAKAFFKNLKRKQSIIQKSKIKIEKHENNDVDLNLFYNKFIDMGLTRDEALDEIIKFINKNKN